MATEHIQNNIDTSSQIVQLNQQSEKQKHLLHAIITSDSNTQGWCISIRVKKTLILLY